MGDFARAKEPAPPERAPERLGHTSEVRPEGPLIWLHAKRPEDAGVAQALVHTLSELRDEPVHALVTTLEAGAPVPANAPGLIHQLVPGDTAGSVKRFLDHWAPDVGVILSAPDRPLLLTEAHGRGCPLFLAAPRRGETGAGGRLGALPASLVNVFDLCLAPSAAEAEALRKHTDDDRVIVTGPLSDIAVAPSCNEAECDAISKQLGGRPVWLSAGTDNADLISIERAHRRATRAAHRLLLIVHPSDSENGEKFTTWFEDMGWRTATRSAGDGPEEDIQVYIADTQDELGLWYRLAPVTFIAGTFGAGTVAIDPFEPAALGSAIIHGSNSGAQAARFRRLANAGATRLASDPGELGELVYGLLSPDKAAALAHAGWLATTESAHVVENLAERIEDVFDRRGTA